VLKITVNASEVMKSLDEATKHLLEKEMRGVVAKAVNEIRDDAIANAEEVGLGRTGLTQKPSGGWHQRRGEIPSGIFAFVEPNSGSTVSAKVAFDSTRDTFHAFFLEFGTRHMSPRPFFMRALSEASDRAVSAAQKRFDEAVARMLK
jgi:HK97 gp10 family phage protein